MTTIKEREAELGFAVNSLVRKLRRARDKGLIPADTPIGRKDPFLEIMEDIVRPEGQESPTVSSQSYAVVPTLKEEIPPSVPPPVAPLQEKPKPRKKRKIKRAEESEKVELSRQLHPIVSLKGYYWGLGILAVTNAIAYGASVYMIYDLLPGYARVFIAIVFAIIGVGVAWSTVLNFLSLEEGWTSWFWKIFAMVTIFGIDASLMNGYPQLNSWFIPASVGIAFAGGLAGAKRYGTVLKSVQVLTEKETDNAD